MTTSTLTAIRDRNVGGARTVPAIDTALEPADALRASAADTRPDPFGERASDATIERTADSLRAKGYAVHVVENGEEARKVVFDVLPEGAEIGQGASTTLEAIGVTHELEESGRYDAVRARTRAMDRTTPEGVRAMRKLGVAPDWYVSSVHALTYDGTIVDVSNTGSQLAPLAFGAGEVIFVIGSQKLVPDLETAMRRIEEHTLPLENQRMQALHGIDSEIKKVLIVHKEFRPGRFTFVLIKEPVGF
jgi:hypothetical protein